ncbi:hypothetical protein HYW76_04560 [Candidatus Pacearchaeota archaeon]|nr:hypothetical protein [Candidatus Pacearchaeota archaeon]
MRKIFFVFMLVILILAANIAYAEEKKVYFFYQDGCSHCAKVEASGVLEKISSPVEKYEISHNKTSRELFLDFANKSGIPYSEMGVPFITIQCGENYSFLLGDSQIIKDLEKSFKDCANTPGEIPNQRLTIAAVVIAALADGLINPCAIGVLAFLLIILTVIGSKKRLIEIVFVYISTIFLVYFLSGLGLFSAIQSLKITSIIFNIGAVILIIGGLINMKDFFWYGKGLSLAIPESKKPLLEKYAHKSSIPAAIVLGFLVALFELPCTGIFYISILGLLAENTTRMGAIPLLLLYNFLFILPLIIISAIVIFGFPPEKVQSWAQGKKRIFRLVMGVIMLALGVIMLSGML